jgi:mRNA interferase RelE/StbE
LFEISFLKSAFKELNKLDKPTAQRMIDRANWLAENIEKIQLHPLKGELTGLYKLREGSYRIVFQILHNESRIIIHSIGHRKDVYKTK